MKSIPPFPWKPVLTLLYLVAFVAGIARLFIHDWWRGVTLLIVSYALLRLALWLWPLPSAEEEPKDS